MTPEHTALVEWLDSRRLARLDEAAAAIRALAGEVERLKEGDGWKHWQQVCAVALDERDTLRAEVERLSEDLELQRKIDLQLLKEKQALRKDAERYRWVRERPSAMLDPDVGFYLVGAQMDTAIDAALADQPCLGDVPLTKGEEDESDS